MNGKYFKGTIILSLGLILTKILGAIYRIVLSNILTSEGIGLYQMIFPVYSLALVFIAGGINTYVSHKVAASADQEKTLKTSFKVAFWGGLIIGCVLALLAFPISFLQGNINSVWGYIIVSVSICFSCQVSVIKGYFQGKQNMIPSAFAQIIEQVFKVFFGILFSLLLIKSGVVKAVTGAVFAITISEFISFVVMNIYYKRKTKNLNNVKIEKKDYIITIKSFLPISLGAIIIPLMQTVDSFMVVNLLNLHTNNTSISTSLFGLYSGMAMPIVNLPIIFCSALTTASLPAFSEKLKKGEDVTAEFNNLCKIVWVLSLACVVGIIFLAKPIVLLIFPSLNLYMANHCTLLLQISSLSIIAMSFLYLATMLLQAKGKFFLPTKALIVSFGFRVLMTLLFVLIPSINIYGLAISNVLSMFIACFVDMLNAKKICVYRLTLKEIFVPVLSVCVMAVVVSFVSSLQFNLIVKLCSSVLIGGGVYLLINFVFGVFDVSSIKKVFFRKNSNWLLDC